MKKCTVILMGKLLHNGHLMPEFKECSERAELNSKKYGGEVVHKYMIKKNLDEGTKLDFVFVVEYPSYEDVIASHSNNEYLEIKSLRAKVFSEFSIQVVS